VLVGLGQQEHKIMHLFIFIIAVLLFLWFLFGPYLFGALIDVVFEKKKWIVYIIGGPLLWVGHLIYICYSKLEDYLRKE